MGVGGDRLKLKRSATNTLARSSRAECTYTLKRTVQVMGAWTCVCKCIGIEGLLDGVYSSFSARSGAFLSRLMRRNVDFSVIYLRLKAQPGWRRRKDGDCKLRLHPTGPPALFQIEYRRHRHYTLFLFNIKGKFFFQQRLQSAVSVLFSLRQKLSVGTGNYCHYIVT